MKCKATWYAGKRYWIVECRECVMIMWHYYANPTIVALPHDIATNHARRYHKE